MGHDYELHEELELRCTPEQVWDAIATGPGIDAWFLGHNEVAPGLGGLMRSDFAGGVIPETTIAAWEPGERLVTHSETAADGRFLAHEHLISAGDGGSTVLRIVTSEFLPGDDWETEFKAMRAGECVFRSSLVEYLTHFAGRKACPITVFSPAIDDWPGAWRALDEALGLRSPERGERVQMDVPGIGPIDGVLFSSNDQSRSIRTPAAMHRFIQGFLGPMVLSHIVFAEPGDTRPDGAGAGQAWQAWTDGLFAHQ